MIQIQATLTMERAKDSSGVPLRKFVCSAEIAGQPVSAEAGTRPAAFKRLCEVINRFGYEPKWTAFRDLDVDDEPDESPVVEPVYVSPRIVPGIEPETLQTPADETDEPGEHEAPEHGLVNCVPVLDKSGWLTPLSDPLAYRRVYLAAWSLATGLSAYARDRTLVGNRDIRAAVAAVMMSGDAGASVGIPAIAVNPWSLGTNGEQEMLWVRVSYKTPDPTTAPFRAGMGAAREPHMKDLSGLAAFPEKAEEWLARREARKFAGTKGADTVGAQQDRLAIRGQAHRAGCAARSIAIQQGLDVQTADTHYKWVYCATLRNLGEIHSVYESQLAEVGITEEMVLNYAQAQQSA